MPAGPQALCLALLRCRQLMPSGTRKLHVTEMEVSRSILAV
jgi:hypothetical protein